MSTLVFVPKPGTSAERLIDAGSGVVGSLTQKRGELLVFFEGNRYGAENMRSYADRVHHANDRMEQAYPTIAKALLPEDELIEVGSYEDGVVRLWGLDDEATVARWLGLGRSPVPWQELVTERVRA